MEGPLPRCVKSLVFVVRFFIPGVSDLGRRHVHRQCDACCQHSLRSVESPLEHRVCFDARHCVFYTLTVVIDPGIYRNHGPCEYLPSLQNVPSEHTEAPVRKRGQTELECRHLRVVYTIAAPKFP